MVVDYIRQLEKSLELDRPLVSETDGVWTLPADVGLSVSITDAAPGYGFYSAFAEVPQTDLEVFFTKAMLANLFGQGTEGAVLGLNDDGTYLTMSMDIPKRTDYKQFEYDLEAFLAAIDYWRAECKNPTK